MAWNKFKKSISIKPPEKTWTNDEMKIVGFVMSKDIKIAMSPDWNHEFKHWQIDIKVRNSRWHTDPKRYDDSEIFESLIKYYKYYYDKYNK